MIVDLVFSLDTICSILATIGIIWVFAPAWTAAIANGLDWDERVLVLGQSPKKQKLLSVIIPAYNEEARIREMLRSAHGFLVSEEGRSLMIKLQNCCGITGYSVGAGVEWIVVNDGSTDGTCAVVEDFCQEPENVCQEPESIHQWKLISLRTNSGKGAAVKTGMLVSSSNFRLMVDADGATDFGPGLQLLVEVLHEQLAGLARNEPDMVAIFGSRAHLQKEGTGQRSFLRSLLMHAFHFFVSLLVSSHIHDTQCGFKLFTKSAAQIVFGTLHLHRWAFDTEVVLISDLEKIRILEVGVPWHEVDGSKLNTSKVALAIASITMLRDMICVRACYCLNVWKVSRR